MKKITQHEAEKRAAKAGVRLLETYQGAQTKILAECFTCGHTWRVWFIQLNRGGGCPKCYAQGMMVTQAEAEKRAKRVNVELLEKYQGVHTKIKMRCRTCGRTWKGMPSKGCKPCARHRNTAQNLTTVEVVRRAAEVNSILLEPAEYKNRNTLVQKRCLTCSHIWQGLFGSRCPACINRKRAETKILNEQEIAKRTARARVKLLEPYQGTHTKSKFLCLQCGHEWKTTLDTISAGHRCPRCARRGCYREKQVRRILERLTGWKFPKANPPFLQGRSGRALELDGYNEEHQVAFEYQGPQHYRCIFSYDTPERLAASKKRDERKRVLCYQHGVLLIRVPYWKQDLEEFIRIKLTKAGLL